MEGVPYKGGILVYRKRVYFGSNSVAKIDYPDPKVDTLIDYKLTTYACLIDLSDLLNQNSFLSHLVWIKDNQEIPVLETYNLKTAIGRLMVLAYQLPNYVRVRAYIPKKLIQLIQSLKDANVNEAKQLIYQTALDISQTLKDDRYFNYCYNKILEVKQRGIILPYDFVEQIEDQLK